MSWLSELIDRLRRRRNVIPPPTIPPPGDWRAEILRLHNEARHTPLATVEELNQFAQRTADNCQRLGRMEHATRREFEQLARSRGGWVSENIAPSANPGVAFGLWRSSPDHWREIVSDRNRYVGFGLAGTFMVAVFSER